MAKFAPGGGGGGNSLRLGPTALYSLAPGTTNPRHASVLTHGYILNLLFKRAQEIGTRTMFHLSTQPMRHLDDATSTQGVANSNQDTRG